MSFCGRDIYEKQSEIAGLQGMLARPTLVWTFARFTCRGGKACLGTNDAFSLLQSAGYSQTAVLCRCRRMYGIDDSLGCIGHREYLKAY